MTVSSWASAMIGNYRRMFKERVSRDCPLTDEEILKICETTHHDASTEIQDLVRLIEMLEFELTFYRK